jgi:hypothetical protein
MDIILLFLYVLVTIAIPALVIVADNRSSGAITGIIEVEGDITIAYIVVLAIGIVEIIGIIGVIGIVAITSQDFNSGNLNSIVELEKEVGSIVVDFTDYCTRSFIVKVTRILVIVITVIIKEMFLE